jgi:DNA-binding response OmpR family regulator
MGDGKRMWLVLNQGSVDLIVLDLMLSEVDGLEVCRKLRAGSEIPVIMLTADNA